jgi:hypothetical protein
VAESSSLPGAAMAEPESRPAFYAARRGGWRDWWTLLHPPYTAWHLSYVVIGACLAPRVEVSRLLATVLAFFLAVGIAAHGIDELQGRPLRTTISSSALVVASLVALSGAIGLGVLGVFEVGPVLLPFIVVGALLVVAYNAELCSGLLRGGIVFAAAWGAFPVLVGYVGQAGTLRLDALLAAGAAFALSIAQRELSSPARALRRRTAEVHGSLAYIDGSTRLLDRELLLRPLENALRAIACGVVLLAAGLAVARLA